MLSKVLYRIKKEGSYFYLLDGNGKVKSDAYVCVYAFYFFCGMSLGFNLGVNFGYIRGFN